MAWPWGDTPRMNPDQCMQPHSPSLPHHGFGGLLGGKSSTVRGGGPLGTARWPPPPPPPPGAGTLHKAKLLLCRMGRAAKDEIAAEPLAMQRAQPLSLVLCRGCQNPTASHPFWEPPPVPREAQMFHGCFHRGMESSSSLVLEILGLGGDISPSTWPLGCWGRGHPLRYGAGKLCP